MLIIHKKKYETYVSSIGIKPGMTWL